MAKKNAKTENGVALAAKVDDVLAKSVDLTRVVETIRLFNNTDGPKVSITFDKPFTGYIKDGDDFVLGDTDTISIPLYRFQRQVRKLKGDVGEAIDFELDAEGVYTQKRLVLLYKKASLTFVRTPHAAGDDILNADGKTVTDDDGVVRTYSRDCFSYEVKGVVLGKFGKKVLEEYTL